MEVVQITEKARTRALELLSREENSAEKGLRIKVIGGGCSGLQYKLGWDNPKEEDHTFRCENGLLVMVDPRSAPYLTKARVEFHDEIERTGFEVINPDACSTCGCGKSFN